MDRTDWWRHLDPVLTAPLPRSGSRSGRPGSPGPTRRAGVDCSTSDSTSDGWRFGHVVRGAVVPVAVAIGEYEAGYRRYLRDRPALVQFLATACGNVYDFDVDERPRRRLRAAAHRDEPLPGHLGASGHRRARRRPGLAGRHGHAGRGRPDARSGHRSRPTRCRGPAGSAAPICSRSATRCRPATHSTRRSCRSTTRP